jgi:hypothetical protein
MTFLSVVGKVLVCAAFMGVLATRARYNALVVTQGGIPATVNNWVVGFYYVPESRQYRQLRAGLRLAGVLEYLSNGEFADQNRLTVDEVHSLMFGHRLHGRSKAGRFVESVERAAIFIAADRWYRLVQR